MRSVSPDTFAAKAKRRVEVRLVVPGSRTPWAVGHTVEPPGGCWPDKEALLAAVASAAENVRCIKRSRDAEGQNVYTVVML